MNLTVATYSCIGHLLTAQNVSALHLIRSDGNVDISFPLSLCFLRAQNPEGEDCFPCINSILASDVPALAGSVTKSFKINNHAPVPNSSLPVS